MCRLFSLCLIAPFLLFPVISGANIPSPELSDVPAMIPISLGGSLVYTVIVEGVGGPVQNSYVEIEFSPDADDLIAWCDGQEHPLLTGVTDVAGAVSFSISGGGCIDPDRFSGPTYIAQVRADGIVLGEVVNSPDAVNSAGQLPTESGTCNCEGGQTQAGFVGNGVSDVHFHVSPIKLGLYETCTNFTYPFDDPVALGDATILTGALTLGGQCSCTTCLPPPPQTQPDARIALHARTPTTKSCTAGSPNATGIPCSDYVTEWPVQTVAFVYLVVAQADPDWGIGALSCGVEYDPGPFPDPFVDWDPPALCADLDWPSGSWPASGGGNRIAWTFDNCQNQVNGGDGVHAVAGAFYVYAYGETQFSLTENKNTDPPELAVTDCFGRQSDLFLGALARVSFGGSRPGCNPCLGPCVPAIQLSEIRIDQPGGDIDEYIELSGTPDEPLGTVSLIVVGDATGAGAGGGIDALIDLSGAIPPDGYWVGAEGTFTLGGTVDLVTSLNFENSDNVTFLLVTERNPALGPGSDLDHDDDGVIDATGDWDGDTADDGPPFGFIVDEVALVETPSSGELFYSTTTVGPDGSSVPWHVYLCSGLEWRIGDPTLGVDDSPDASNPLCRPAFLDLSRVPCIPGVGDSAMVTVQATSSSGASLRYSINQVAETVLPMLLISDVDNVQEYEALIPDQTDGDLVGYVVEIVNSSPDTTWSDLLGYSVGTADIGDLRTNDGQGQNLYAGFDVRLEGVTTSPYAAFSNQTGTITTDYYIQDATGGINVFQFGVHGVQPVLGDSVTVVGSLTQFNGKLEITDSPECGPLQVTTTGSGLVPAPDSTNCGDSREGREGKLVYMRVLLDSVLVGGTFAGDSSYPMVQSGCQNLVLRIDGDTDIPGMAVTYPMADIYGILTQFDSSLPWSGGYQIQPRSRGDIVFLADPVSVPDDQTPLVARLFQNYPNPFSQATQIGFEVTAAAGAGQKTHVRLSVFDVQGRLVRVLVDDYLDPGKKTVTLREADLPESKSGIYFYRLTVGDKTLTRKLLLVRG